MRMRDVCTIPVACGVSECLPPQNQFDHLCLRYSHYAPIYSNDADTRVHPLLLVEKKRKDYAFQRQFKEKPSIIPDCPDLLLVFVDAGCFLQPL